VADSQALSQLQYNLLILMQRTIDIDANFACEPDRLFAAWTEPALLEGWLCECASGSARQGHALELGWPSLGLSIRLRVDGVEAGRRLRLVGLVAGEPQVHEVFIESLAAGGARLRLQHSAREPFAHGIESGWRIRLHLLERYLASGGRRRIVAEAASYDGGADEVYEQLAAGPALAGFERASHEFPPDGLLGAIDAKTVYVLRRFPGSQGSQLIAGQAMSWSDAVDLEAHRPALARAIDVRTHAPH